MGCLLIALNQTTGTREQRLTIAQSCRPIGLTQLYFLRFHRKQVVSTSPEQLKESSSSWTSDKPYNLEQSDDPGSLTIWVT